MRLAEVYKISGEAFLGETHRKTPDITSVIAYDEKKKKSIKIKPGEYFLGSPLDLVKETGTSQTSKVTSLKRLGQGKSLINFFVKRST